MQTMTEEEIDVKLLAPRMVEALKDDRVDEAEAIYQTLCKAMPEVEDLLVFPVFFAIQRGQAREALQAINGMPDDRCPELKAICLNLLQDPTWHAVAESLQDSPDLTVRKAMRELLGRPLEMA